jgi:quercetin dioxygenase-like cupin family protein
VRTTVYSTAGSQVIPTVVEEPAWEPFSAYDGQPLRGVRRTDIDVGQRTQVQLNEIAAGGRFVMHASPDLAFCQIVRGKGKLGLPDGREIPYEGPELYVFLPNALHDWHDIEEDTLLAVCLAENAPRA